MPSKKVNSLLKKDILKYQYVSVILEAKLEDSGFGLVEGVLLRKENDRRRVTEKITRRVPEPTVQLWAGRLQGSVHLVPPLPLFWCSLRRVIGREARHQ